MTTAHRAPNDNCNRHRKFTLITVESARMVLIRHYFRAASVLILLIAVHFNHLRFLCSRCFRSHPVDGEFIVNCCIFCDDKNNREKKNPWRQVGRYRLVHGKNKSLNATNCKHLRCIFILSPFCLLYFFVCICFAAAAVVAAVFEHNLNRTNIEFAC